MVSLVRHLLEQRTKLLQRMVDFFNGGEAPLTVSRSLKIRKLLEATQRAYDSGKTEPVE